MLRTMTSNWILSIILTLLSLSVRANDIDSHLNMTAHLLRVVGFTDEQAKFLAYANQFIDISPISSPMLFPAQRQLFHFPGDLEKVNIEGHGAMGVINRIFETQLAIAERNHPLGNYLIYKALKNGDLTLLGLGFHVKMDSTGSHPGFSNLLGHLADGHNPDRTFLYTRATENMVRSMVQSMVQTRNGIPEAQLDFNSTLKYLNTYAKKTSLKRDLTRADLDNPVLLSDLVLQDPYIQKMIREDIFKKREYKIIALSRILKSFKDRKIVDSTRTLFQVFPKELVNDPRYDVHEIMKFSYMSYLSTYFNNNLYMPEMGGIAIDTQKEKKEMMDLFNIEVVMKEFNLSDFNLKKDVEVARFQTRLQTLKFMAEKKLSESEADSIFEARLAEEIKELLNGLEVDLKLIAQLNADQIKFRAEFLAYEKLATDFSYRMTKDFIPHDPRKYNDYIRQNFEGETENYKFEGRYKSELWRRFYSYAWGSNWVIDEGVDFKIRFRKAISKFSQFITGIKNKYPRQQEIWERLADQAAAEVFKNEFTPTRDGAQKVKFNFMNRLLAEIKLAVYVIPAIPLGFGYMYIQKILKIAKAHAKSHEIENMKEAFAAGKYKLFTESKKSKAALSQIQKIKKGSRLQCVYLFQ